MPLKFIIEKPNARIWFPSTPMYSGVLPIKAAKRTDLKKIVSKYVPEVHRSFYYDRIGAQAPDNEADKDTDDCVSGESDDCATSV